MPDRTANWGESQSAAKYQTGDSDPTGGNFIVARKADGSAELLVWNDTAGQWESGGPVDMGGNDITNAGAISADALEASNVEITPVDSGSVTVAAGSVVGVVSGSEYLGDHYILALTAAGDGAKNGYVRKRLDQSSNGNPTWQIEEIGGSDDWSGEYALHKVSVV